MRIKANTKKGYEEVYEYDCLDLSYPKSKNRRGRVQHGKSQTLTAGGVINVVEKNYRIRKLTPKEAYRLMGFAPFTETENGIEFDDSNFNRAEEVLSNTRLYKTAGNSIVVDVIEHIIEGLL